MNPIPWIPFAARDFLEPKLQPHMKVFEWGSGGSTIWFAQRVAHVTSIEHWDRYRDLLMISLDDYNITNVTLHFVLPGKGRINAHPDVDHPDNYFGHRYERAFDNENFKTYVASIDAFPDSHFDVVFVDGQARSACLKHGPPKVKPGGFLMFDNSDRKRHFKFIKFPQNDWETFVFNDLGPDYGRTGLPWECTIYRRSPDGQG